MASSEKITWRDMVDACGGGSSVKVQGRPSQSSSLNDLIAGLMACTLLDRKFAIDLAIVIKLALACHASQNSKEYIYTGQVTCAKRDVHAQT